MNGPKMKYSSEEAFWAAYKDKLLSLEAKADAAQLRVLPEGETFTVGKILWGSAFAHKQIKAFNDWAEIMELGEETDE